MQTISNLVDPVLCKKLKMEFLDPLCFQSSHFRVGVAHAIWIASLGAILLAPAAVLFLQVTSTQKRHAAVVLPCVL